MKTLCITSINAVPIYDYSETEDYNARYAMTDLNIGRKLNVITGVRLEDNITRYILSWTRDIPSAL